MGIFDVFKKKSMFSFDEERKCYKARINNISFICEQIRDGYEQYAIKLANVYEQKLPDVVEFLLLDIQEVFGINDIELIQHSLGEPEIDLDSCRLSYLNHSLDDVHIIDIEFGGLLDEFLYSNIDG